MRTGNKINSFLNREWARHVRGFLKRKTSKRRRQLDTKIIKNQMNET